MVLTRRLVRRQRGRGFMIDELLRVMVGWPIGFIVMMQLDVLFG